MALVNLSHFELPLSFDWSLRYRPRRPPFSASMPPPLLPSHCPFNHHFLGGGAPTIIILINAAPRRYYYFRQIGNLTLTHGRGVYFDAARAGKMCFD
jgi:hypothetical protein